VREVRKMVESDLFTLLTLLLLIVLALEGWKSSHRGRRGGKETQATGR
jgi:hypothetical protein